MIQQYSDFVIEPPGTSLVKDHNGALYTGQAKLYVANPEQDVASVAPVTIAVTAGTYSWTGYADTPGTWIAQVRCEGETKGSSEVLSFNVAKSPFNTPVA